MDECACLMCGRRLSSPDVEFCTNDCRLEYREAQRDEAFFDSLDPVEDTPCLDNPWWHDK
jgi:hypothetical protein